MMKLYYAPGTVALSVHIALEEAGADYEATRLDFPAGEQRGAEYLAINPKGRVPALVTDRGVITEVPAVLAYIAQTHPAANLAPADPFEFAQVQAFNAYLCATVHVAHAHRMRGSRWADDPAAIEHMKGKVAETMGDAVDLIENGMLKGEWVMGESYSICDPYLFTASRWLDVDGVPAERHPRVRAHMARMAERPAAKAALAAQGLG
ncbi:MAG: glutathione S-transferase family protein [Alphaproteobacteria bacterium]|nr:glutathione S-transferase family protein [Alphaproteobacteria bacterium]